jgi:hypothetical protein
MTSDDNELNEALKSVDETIHSLQEQEEIEMEQHYQRALYQANQASLASYLFGVLVDSPLGKLFTKASVSTR